MNILTLDLSDPDLDEAVRDCQPGQTKELTITVTPTLHEPGKQFIATVDSVAYNAADADSEGTPEAEVEAKPLPGAKKGAAASQY